MVILIKDAYLRSALIISFVLLAIGFASAYVSFADVNDLLVIHFDSYKGIDFLGTKINVLEILLVGLVINITNFFLAIIFYHRERFLSRLIVYFNVFLSLLILISVAVIISIN